MIKIEAEAQLTGIEVGTVAVQIGNVLHFITPEDGKRLISAVAVEVLKLAVDTNGNLS